MRLDSKIVQRYSSDAVVSIDARVQYQLEHFAPGCKAYCDRRTHHGVNRAFRSARFVQNADSLWVSLISLSRH